MARARSFGNIRKLPSGRYQAALLAPRQTDRRRPTFASKTDARRWLVTVEADMVRGALDRSRRRSSIPFGEYATRWVAERPVRPRTREIYEGQLRHIVLVFANVQPLRRPPGRRADVARPARSGRPAPQHGREDLPAVPFDHDDRRRRRADRPQPGPHQGRVGRADDRAPAADVGRRSSARRRDPPEVRVPGLDGRGERPALRRARRPHDRTRRPRALASCA